jgi:Ca2+-transporting ATPase
VGSLHVPESRQPDQARSGVEEPPPLVRRVLISWQMFTPDGSNRHAGGLTSHEAARRLGEQGPNEIRRAPEKPAWILLARQFNSPVIWLLAGACAISATLGEVADAAAIVGIVVLNSAIGFSQERRAERAILALRSLTAPRARVRRDGRSIVIPASAIVTGDVVLLEAGDLVPADAGLLEARALSINEASLTGESAPVEKSIAPAPGGAALAERSDAVFMGTAVATGTAVAEVVATGMSTELGRIAHLLATAEDTTTPLQQRLAGVSRVLLYACLAIVGVVAAAGLLRGWGALDVLLSAVSLAVAAVPEGLPAIVTIALAVGVQRMASRHVLIRRLHAVETLGCATVICTDKTGTLTTGAMTVRELWGADHDRLLFAAAACSDAELHGQGVDGVGDPTELAILAAAADRGIRRRDIEEKRPRVHVRPFDPARKRMSLERADGVLYVKGAMEVILPLCLRGTDGAIEANARMTARGLRVLAAAIGHGHAEQELDLLGLIGIADPPRQEAIEAIAAARAAGIRTVMITGDHPATAAAIARELGILDGVDRSDQVVHARATPEDKLAIVRSWKARGEVVAMTGDGVNDAPALREAHIGIAMGRTGTEVTREASDMVLTDDNFASIIAAVKEGRGVYENIRKTLVYLLAGNTSELAVMLVAALAGLPLPLLPLQLLWINIVTDGLPALALVMDPTEGDVLKRPPRDPDEPMLGRAQWQSILWTGLLEGGAVLGVFAWVLRSGTLFEARSVAFSTLVFGELFRAFAARSPTRIFWTVGAFTNLRLLGVVAVSVLVQGGIHHFAATRAFFGIGSLSPAQWALAVTVGLGPVTVIEILKLLRAEK